MIGRENRFLAIVFEDIILLPGGGVAMRAREWPSKLYEIAESQLGYFTAAQARIAGVHQVRLVQLHQSGDIERVSRGVYRLARFPLSPLGQYMEAALWPQVRRPDTLAVISHASALALHELSEVNPAKIHHRVRARSVFNKTKYFTTYKH